MIFEVTQNYLPEEKNNPVSVIMETQIHKRSHHQLSHNSTARQNAILPVL